MISIKINQNIDITAAAKRLYDKLSFLDEDQMNISDYSKVQFRNRKANLKNSLNIYSYLLSLSIINISLEDFCFIDYGGGTGILAMLAKELGIGTVIYNDIYDISCHDAEKLAGAVGNKAEYYIQGDIDEAINFCNSNNIKCSSVASYDVIEHIYDIDAYFKKLYLLSPATIVMASGANSFNPFIRRSLMKKAKNAEYEHRDKKYGHKERDSLESYFALRRKIIQEHLLYFPTF